MEEWSATAARLEPVGRIIRRRNPPLRRRGNKTAEYASLFRPTRSASVARLDQSESRKELCGSSPDFTELVIGPATSGRTVGSGYGKLITSCRPSPRRQAAAVIELEREPRDRPDAVFLDRLDKNNVCRFRAGRRKI